MEELVKVIFQLEGDSSKAVAALNEVNAKYKEQNFQLNRQQMNLKTLQENEAALLAGRAKSQNPTAIARYNKKIEEQRKKIDDVKKSIDQMTAAEVKTAKATEDLGKKINKAFDKTQTDALSTGVKKFNNEVKDTEKPLVSLRTQLKQLKAQLVNTTDEEEFIRLSQEVGRLEDKFKDAREAANVFATGSRFEQFGLGIRGVAGDLLNLDFEGASEKSKILLETTKGITFKDAITGLGNLGKTLLNTGKAILSNPLFLIAGVLTAVILNFETLVNLGGPIGAFFKGISNVINFVKDSFFALTDAIGATTNALDKQTKTSITALNDQLNLVRRRYDEEIQLSKAASKDVKNAELDKLQFVEENLNNQIKVLEEAKLKKGKLNSEELEQHKELQEQIYEATLERKTRELQLKQDFNKLKLNIDKQATLATLSEREKELFIQKEINKQQLDEFDALFNTQLGNEEKNFQKRQKLIENQNREIQKINKKYDEIDADAKAKAYEEDFQRRLSAKQKQIEFEEGGIADLARIQDEERQRELNKVDLFNQTKDEINLVNSAKSVDIERAEAEEKRKIQEEYERQRQAQIQQELNDIQTIANAAINASQQVISARIAEVNELRSIQQKRVDDARAIAEDGNVELLNLEQERLDELNKQREVFVRRQQALATLELIANSAIAVSKAAAQGGAAAAVTIAATLIALVGGLAQARSIASQGAFYDGGYTGDGDPKQTSTAIGKKPYTYHKGEFVFNHEKTGKYKDIFQDIHKGNIDLNDWQNKVSAFEQMRVFPSQSTSIDISSLQKELQVLRSVIEGQQTSVDFNEHGLALRFRNIKSRQDFIKNNLGRA